MFGFKTNHKKLVETFPEQGTSSGKRKTFNKVGGKKERKKNFLPDFQ